MILHKDSLSSSLSSEEDLFLVEDEVIIDIDDTEAGQLDLNVKKSESTDVWKIAIVDDDATVHLATKLALKNLVFENKSLKFFSAYSISEAKQLIIDHPDIAFILLDVVMETNDAGLKIVRYIREELKNQTVQIILRTGQPGEAPEESVILAYDINDYKLKTELTRQKLITAVIAALRAYRNAIALKEQAAQLSQTLQTLERTQFQLIHSEKMSTLGNLVLGVVHEINNPLSWISGNLALLEEFVNQLLELTCCYQQLFAQDETKMDAKVEAVDLEYLRQDLPDLIRSTKEGTDRLRRLSSSLQTFSKVETATKVPFNIHEGIESTLLLLKHRLRANGTRPAIEVIKDYGNIPLVECFPSQINQAFMHLLINAIDALKELNWGRSFEEIQSHPNQITIQTTLRDEQHIVIYIRDNGIGMSEAEKQRAFDALFTTKPVGQGTGLGLAIVRQIIVEKHGGSIDVVSSPGQGSTFIIKLPVQTHQN